MGNDIEKYAGILDFLKNFIIGLGGSKKKQPDENEDQEGVEVENGTPVPQSQDVPDSNVENTQQVSVQPQDQQTYAPVDLSGYSNIEGILPEETYNALPSTEDVMLNTIPEGYEEVVNDFYPVILDYNVFVSTSDISFDALSYMGAMGLGATEVEWVLGRESLSDEEKHKMDYHSCKCDANNGNTFSINDILQESIRYANEKRFSPPAPLYAMAGHPNCQCSLLIRKTHNFPSLDSIPDTCPGLPKTSDINRLREVKNNIWNNIPDTLYINAKTYPPLHISTRTAFTYNRDHIEKYAKKLEEFSSKYAISYNKPMMVNVNCISILDYGFWIPINAGYVGMLVGILGKKGVIYISEIGYEVKLPLDNLVPIKSLTEADNQSDKDTHFVLCDGKIRVLHSKTPKGYKVYNPESRSLEDVTQFTKLTFKS